MLFFSHLLPVLASALEAELFEKGNIDKALEMEVKEPIDYALRYFLLKQFQDDSDKAVYTALSAPEDNEFILLLTARMNSGTSKMNLPQNVRVALLKELSEKISTRFFENKYDFRELMSLQSMDVRMDALDVLKNIRGRDELILYKFFYYLDARVYLLKNVIAELDYLAKKKNKTAYCFLGQAYLTGAGVEKDIDKAFEYFWAGKDTNKASAFLGIGKIMTQEDYLNIDAAINAFKLAKDGSNDAEANYCLYQIYTALKKTDEAAECLKNAAISGYLPAVEKYTANYLEQGLNDSAIYSMMSITQYSPVFIKYDEMAFDAYLKKDYRKACLIYLFLSEFNLPVAITNAIYLMEKHSMFKNQNTILLNLYQQTVLTNPSFNKKIGDCYFYGKGVEKSHTAAFNHYLASKPYSTEGAYATAYMYEAGLGVPKNLFEARRIINNSLNRESLYLVKFYALIRIYFKIVMFHFKLPLMLIASTLCLSAWTFRLFMSKKVNK